MYNKFIVRYSEKESAEGGVGVAWKLRHVTSVLHAERSFRAHSDPSHLSHLRQ